MDFLALPRRDLQALCKRNGVRANMTSAAMADALRALPKIDGIEEYFKPPVPAPEPEVEAVVEEHNIGRQGSPLPRSRRVRVASKSSEPIETEEDNEEEKGIPKRPSNKEDAQALGVGRRGASRRARPVPVVPQPTAVAAEVSQVEEDLKREAKQNNAPAPVVDRRGASRRARPSPAVAAPAAESEVPGAEEEQREVVEDLKRDASMDDAPALGVGRRAPSRRARPATPVPAMASKVVAKAEQRAPTPRGRRVKATGTSTKPIRLDASDDEENEDTKPQEDAQILGVGRRGGAGRRAQVEPVVAAPEAKAEEEQRAPIPRGRGIKAKSDDREEEKKEDTKPEEETGDVPAIGVGRRGASHRAPAPSGAPATRRSAAASKAEEAVPIRATRQRKPTMKAAAAAAAEEKAPPRATRRGALMSSLLQQEVPHEPQEAVGAQEVVVEAVPIRASTVMSSLLQQEVPHEPQEAVGAPEVAVEAVPIRATRHRKPTMKAAAAATTAQEKAPPRATRRGAVVRTVLQPVVQEEPEGVLSDAEAVGAPVSYQQCDVLEEESQEAVGAPVSYQQCDALQELEEASDPQKEELNEDEDEDVVIIENEKLMEETPTEESNEEVNIEDGLSCQEEGDVVIDKVLHSVDDTILLDCSSDISWVEVMITTFSKMHENKAALDEDGDKPDGVVIGDSMSQATVTDEVVQEEKGVLITDEMPQGTAARHDMEDDQFETVLVQADHECTDNKSEMKEQLVDVEKCHAPLASQEESLILGLDSMVTEQSSEDDESANFQEGGGSSSGPLDRGVCEQTYDAGEEMDLELGIRALQAPLTTNESDVNHEIEIGSVREEISEVDTKDDEVCKEKEHMNIAELQANIVDEAAFLEGSSNDTILLDCSSEISWVEVMLTFSKMHENQAALDEDGDKPDGVVIGDSMSQATVTDEVVQEEKGVLITDEMPQGTAAMHDMDDDQFETVLVQADHESTDNKSVMQEQQVDVEKCHALLATQEESPILLISMVTEQASENDESAKDDGGSSSDLLDTGVCEETCDAGEEMECVPGIPAPLAPLSANEIHDNHESEIGSVRELISEVGTKDDEICKEKEHMDITEFQRNIVYEAACLECSGNVSQAAGEETNEDDQFETVFVQVDQVLTADMEVKTEDGLSCQEDVVVKVLHDWVDTVLLDCSSDISSVEVEKAGSITSEMHENQAALDEDGDKPNGVLIGDSMSQASVADEVVQEEKGLLITDEMPQGTADTHDMEDDHFQTVFVQADQVVTADNLPEQVTDCEITVEENTSLIADEKQHSTVIMNGDVVFDHLKTDTAHADEQREVIGIVTEVPDEVTGTINEVVEEKVIVITEDMPHQGTVPNITDTMDECLKENHFGTDFGHGNEQKKAITATVEPEASRAQDGVAQKENALLDDVTESVCKNSSEKNTAEPMAVLEEKVASESEDLNKLTLGQLRAKLKEKLNAKKIKEAKKRVALATVDENVCRSHAKGQQQQNLNLQQH